MSPEPKPPPEPAPRTNPGYQYSPPVVKRLKMFLPDGTYGAGPVVVELDGGAVAYYGKIGR